MPLAGAPILVGDNARYRCKATQLTQQSVTSATLTNIAFDDADTLDDLGIHDPVTLNSRFVIGLALGWWLVVGTVVWNTSAVASGRRSQLNLNGTGINGSFTITPILSANGFWSTQSETIVQATAATDYVELQGYQDTGVALTTRVSGAIRSQMLCMYLGA
jgi:hypothetical protein